MIREPEWMADAACRIAVREGTAYLTDWFPRTIRGRARANLSPQLARAVAICGACPVRERCLETYKEDVPPWRRVGLWGGVLFGYGRNATHGGRGQRLVESA